MGHDYLMVHLIWTIPPALLMTVIYWPFFTKLQFQKLLTLVFIAVLSTIPWDSYLIRNKIWGYPAHAVAGPTLFAIPLEEVFFFVIQTYTTGLLYVILTKRLVLPIYLRKQPTKLVPYLGASLISVGLGFGLGSLWAGGRYTYLGLILSWVCPFIMLQWVMSCRFLLALPRREIILSISLPTLYLWAVDNLALQRGTWVINKHTKLDLQLWGSLDVEEAFFFLSTNVMIVLGLVAIDNAIAMEEYQIVSSSEPGKQFPSFAKAMLLYLTNRYDKDDKKFLQGLTDAVQNLAKKSQSMHMGSAMFQGPLRINLILLYFFCRVMDDLVDEAPNREMARHAIQQCSRLLEMRFTGGPSDNSRGQSYTIAEMGEQDDSKNITLSIHSSLSLLPVSRLTINPFIDLLLGFETDLLFCSKNSIFPIATEKELETYAYQVAGTIAISVLELLYSHHHIAQDPRMTSESYQQVIKAGSRMGQALQYVNIARDIEHDAAIGRVYIPTSWLREKGLTPSDVLAQPKSAIVETLRDRLLDKADAIYLQSVGAIDVLPSEGRGAIRTTVESYMIIGEMLREKKHIGSGPGKLKVPLYSRLRVAWWAMCGEKG